MRRRALLAALACAAASSWLPARGQPAAVDLDTPFVITPDAVVAAMLDLARLRPGERLIDLGSGDGRIVIAAALRGAVAHGVDIDNWLVVKSRAAAQRAGVAERATFAAQDLFETDVSGADVVTLYLLPDVNAKLAPRLYASLRPGARIVSHDYGLGDWAADAAIEVDAPDKPVGLAKRSRLLAWTVPARVGGRWRGRAGDAPLEVDFEQAWQQVTGVVRWQGRAWPFAGARVEGAQLGVASAPAVGPALALRLALTRDGALAGELLQGSAAPMRVELRRAVDGRTGAD